MTVCGEKVTGVCVMGKCPHIKRCCSVVWDKYGKIKPQTNEEWRKTCSEEEFAEALTKVVLNIVAWNNDPKPSEVRNTIKAWLKQPYQRGDTE